MEDDPFLLLLLFILFGGVKKIIGVEAFDEYCLLPLGHVCVVFKG